MDNSYVLLHPNDYLEKRIRFGSKKNQHVGFAAHTYAYYYYFCPND